MKSLFTYIAALIIGTTFIGGAASAATCTGSISVTGPGSTNSINCNEVNNIVVTCDNNVIVGTVNTQNGESGNSDTSNNTTSGSATSGNVVNENGQDVTIGASCNESTLTSSDTPGSGGSGGGGAVIPETLPDTAGQSPFVMFAIGGLLLGGITLLYARVAQRLHR